MAKDKKETEKIFVKPAPGGMVRDPVSLQFLDASGEYKPRNTYWLRRVRMGDVVVGEEKKQSKKQDAYSVSTKGEIK